LSQIEFEQNSAKILCALPGARVSTAKKNAVHAARAACVKGGGMATARFPAPVRRTCSPSPPNRVTSLSRRASALAFRCNASASSRAAVSGAPTPALDAPPASDPRTGATRSLFCFGLGYTSLGLAETLRRAGWRVAGTCRSAERARALEAAGIPAFVWCPDEREFLDDAGVAALRDATHVLVSVPPTERDHHSEDRSKGPGEEAAPPSIDPVLADAACVAALSRARAADERRDGGEDQKNATPKTRRLQWLAYLSSTGVYGDHFGNVVDETSRCVPTTAKTRARLDAERAWEAFARCENKGGSKNVRLRVFRLGGVYGPRRSLLDAAARGTETEPNDVRFDSKSRSSSGRAPRNRSSRFSRAFVARCHVRDVVAILCASARLADDEDDATPCDADSNVFVVECVFRFERQDVQRGGRRAGAARRRARVRGGASRRTKTNVSVESEAEAEAEARVVNDRGEKRVSNERAKTELGVFFAFPTYKEGLTAIADGDTSPFSEKTLDLL
jgi:nucleoside-diphosphate-sugar epimerase